MANALHHLRQTIAGIENRMPDDVRVDAKSHHQRSTLKNVHETRSDDWILQTTPAMADLAATSHEAPQVHRTELHASQQDHPRHPLIRLPKNAVMELSAKAQNDAGALTGFTLALLSSLPDKGDILWCQTQAAAREFGSPYMPGLARFPILPERVLYVCTKRSIDLLWVAEEALKSGSLAAIVGEGANADFTQSRRLALAAQQGATPCLLLDVFRSGAARAAAMRWVVASASGGSDCFDARAPGAMTWLLTLTHARSSYAGSQPGSWPHSLNVAWNDETHTFDLVSQPPHRTSQTGEMVAQTKGTAELIPLRRAG